MSRYSDEYDVLTELAQQLRLAIARRLALEAGLPDRSAPGQEQLAAADAAIAAWAETGEEQLDPAAFRPTGPLQRLLADYTGIVARIEDVLDRRLS